MLTNPLDLTVWPPEVQRTGARKGLLCVLLTAAALVVVPSLCGQAPQQAPPPAAPALPAGYVGTETCAACHEEVLTKLDKTPHAEIPKVREKWAGMTCEACHGPGAKHAETNSPADIFNPAKAAPSKATDTCLKCHRTATRMAGWTNSPHSLNQVSCIACHKVHETREQLIPRTAAAINVKCAGCHTAVVAQFQRPYRHPVPEGVMSCVDCHNPHGTLNPRNQIRFVAANEYSCFKCHTNLRGPYVFEHPSVKIEGCQACHMPHGSVNPRLLTRSRVAYLCLDCHATTALPVRAGKSAPAGSTAVDVLGGIPPSFHNINLPTYQNCTICHISIHGSNVSQFLER